METKGSVFSRVFKAQFMLQVLVSLYVLLFLYAATSKLLDYDAFLLQMRKSPLISDFAGILVWLVPGLEIGIVLLLVLPRTTLWGLYSAFGLMSMFTVYIYLILNYSNDVPCSCGGVIGLLGWGEHMIFNLVFAGLAVIGIVLHGLKIKKRSLVGDT